MILVAAVISLIAQHEHHEKPAGYADVMIARDRFDALELDTAVIEERALTKTIRTVGLVALDETRTTHVHAKVRGFVESISANFVGRKIRAGEPLCTIFSPDVYAAELELAALLDQHDRVSRAARRRLELWDVPEQEIARLESTRQPSRTFPLLAPRSGTIVAKQAVEGVYIDPSLELFTVSDLSRIWILADLYGDDFATVRPGDAAELRIQGYGPPLDAEVKFVSPVIEEATRTRKIRFELANPEGRLLPGAFVSVTMELPLGTGPAVPDTAVILTGARAIVFVAHPKHRGHFTPREIVLGPRGGGYYRVESGLDPGERVAVGAQFLLDSESRLRASGGGGGHVH